MITIATAYTLFAVLNGPYGPVKAYGQQFPTLAECQAEAVKRAKDAGAYSCVETR